MIIDVADVDRAQMVGQYGRDVIAELDLRPHRRRFHTTRGHRSDDGSRPHVWAFRQHDAEATPSRLAASTRAEVNPEDAGPDQTVMFGQPVQLAGVVIFSNSPPVMQWKLYSGPGTVTFGNAAQTNTTANFSAPGIYTLELGADDGVHAVAYDAVVITVTNVINVSIVRAGTNVNLSWVGGVAPYVVQRTAGLPAASWSDLVTTNGNSTNLSTTNTSGFFRVKGQ